MVDSPRKHPELEALEGKYKLGELKLYTIEGQRWKNRMEASDAYFRDYSKNWKQNQELYSGFEAMVRRYGTYVALGFSSIQNWINDTYFRNPDPLVQDKGGNKDLGQMLSHLFKSVLKEADSESKVKQGLLDVAWAGFSCPWVSFQQNAYLDETLFDFSIGKQGALVPTKQQVRITHISPYRIRFDPTGREWDLSDHGWIAILYEQTLAQVMRDPTVSEEDRRRIMAYYGSGGPGAVYDATQVRYSEYSSFREQDPEFIKLAFWHIWSRPDHMTYRMPVNAQFFLTPQPWPAEFAEEDIFPCVYIAKNRDVEDESRLKGFIGIPDMTLIEPHIKNINKLEALLMAACQHVINKYVTIKGALDTTAQQKLADGTKQFSVIELDKDALNQFPTQMQEKLSLKDVLSLVPQAELKELWHLKAIANEMSMIQQVMGQGPGDRGGVSEANSATESLGMQQGLGRRMANAQHENGRVFCALMKLVFITLKARQTLPLRYQMTTAFSQQVWQEFNADSLRNLDLHFEYAVGSTEFRTREQEFALRERMATVLMPVLQAQQNNRLMLKLAQDLIEPLNILGSEQFFDDQAAFIAQKLLAILRGLGKGTTLADDPKAAMQIPELVAQLAQAILTPQQLAEVEAAVNQAQPPQPEGQGSLPAPPTPGQADAATAAAGSAAAGADGGMAN